MVICEPAIVPVPVMVPPPEPMDEGLEPTDEEEEEGAVGDDPAHPVSQIAAPPTTRTLDTRRIDTATNRLPLTG